VREVAPRKAEIKKFASIPTISQCEKKKNCCHYSNINKQKKPSKT